MKTIEINLYEFKELAPEAKERAIAREREARDYPWSEENRASLEVFERIFPIKITNWSYGGRGEGVDFHFTCEDYIEDLKGQRLATYLWNNYRHELWYGKYMGNIKAPIKYPRIKSEKLTNPGRKADTFNPYYSCLFLETNCVLTGYYIDNFLTDPIHKFISNPDEQTTFKDLLETCFSEWIKGCKNDVEDYFSDERIIEDIEENEYTFEADGTMRNE